MTASRTNKGRRRTAVPPPDLALYRCYCHDFRLPHDHQLGDHPGFGERKDGAR